MRDKLRSAQAYGFHTPVEFIPPLLTDFDVIVIIQAADELGGEIGALGTRHGQRTFDEFGDVEGGGAHVGDIKRLRR